ncbi:WD repeat-containing protein 88, variant 2 [Schistosoma haematobium]|uniref:WD repeat-containing protein 88, variant 2 n=1 Tax=Schistosoma haematobium TaxID=6185 RepID=A0A922S3D3_SCHHA|nr:WD repeat-containing protein 88, variant 2 [Schistosoma haematobium]KAH9591756.1 WD repeat-containing protein 88, variant 2 [Schistosoma haematobium]
MENEHSNDIVFQGHTDSVTSLSYNDQLEHVVSVSCDQTLRVWSLKTREQIGITSKHATQLNSVNIDSNGLNIISSGMDFRTCLFDYETLKLKFVLLNGGAVTDHSITKDGNCLVCVTDISCQMNLWDLRWRKKVFSIPDIHENTPTCCLFTPNENCVVTTSTDGSAKCTDLRSLKTLLTLRDHRNAVSSAAIARDGKLLVTTSWDKAVHLYDIETGNYRREGPQILADGHTGSISSCDIDDNGIYLATGGHDKCVILWDTEKKEVKLCLKRHTDWINDVHMTKDGKWILTASKDRLIRSWNMEVIERLPFSYLPGNEQTVLTLKCPNCEKNFIQTVTSDWRRRPKCLFCDLDAKTNN